MRRFNLAIAKAFLTVSLITPSLLTSVLATETGFIRAMPSSVPNSAAYFTLTNDTAQDKVLTRVTTSFAKEAQLHTLVERNGVLSMTELTELIVPANGSLALKPQGDHVMLLGLTEPANEGKYAQLTLHFADGSQQQLTLPIRRFHQQHSDHVEAKKTDNQQLHHMHHE